MIQQKLISERGVAVGLIIALIAVIVLAIWSWTEAAKAKKCLASITGKIATYNEQWENSKRAGNPDLGVCRQLNDFINDYNNACGAKYGTIPRENCG